MYFDGANNPTDEFTHKMMIGSAMEETNSIFNKIVMDSSNTMTATRRDGQKYQFELVDVNSSQVGRITKIVDANGDLGDPASPAMVFTYAIRPDGSPH